MYKMRKQTKDKESSQQTQTEPQTESDKQDNSVPKPLPEWLSLSEPVSLDKIEAFLKEYANQLDKSVYRQIIAKLRDLLYLKQNEDAINRSKAFRMTRDLSQVEKEIEEKKLILERLKKNEARDKAFITLQQKELRSVKKEVVKKQNTIDSKKREEEHSVKNDPEKLFQFETKRFEQEWAAKDSETLTKMSQKEKELTDILQKLKKIKSSKLYGQDKLLAALAKYRDK